MSTPNDWLNRKQISTTDINSPTHSCGRTPWYGQSSPESKRRKRTFLIGVAGGTASGKTSVCRAVVDHLQLPWVQILSMDCFYRPLTDKERGDNYNFDHPNAFDWELLLSVLKELKQGKAVKCPQYDFTTHSRKKEFTLMYGADVVLCEGILILHDPKILEQFDVKVFVKTDDDIRLIRRIKRDMANRGRTLDGILAQYQATVKPSYHTFCEPTQAAADVVIPRGRDNVVAIQLLCDHIKNKLIEGGNVDPVFYKSDQLGPPSTGSSTNSMPSNVLVPERDGQVQAAIDTLHSEQAVGPQLLQNIMVLCNKLLTLCLDEFMPRRFFTPSPSPRLRQKDFNVELKAEEEVDEDAEIIMFVDDEDDEGEALKELQFPSAMSTENTNEIDIGAGLSVHDLNEELMDRDHAHNDGSRQSLDGSPALPTDGDMQLDDLDGRRTPGQRVCVVTIFSGGMLFGETIMEQLGHNKSFKMEWGSIHIFHESKKPAKPRFYDRQLPLNIHEQKVIMVDAFIGTGNRARMAIQVIIDHHVPQHNICFIALESSARGIVNLAKVFPNVQFITARIGQIQNDKHWETVPETSSLVIKYCKAAGIEIVDDESEQCSASMSPIREAKSAPLTAIKRARLMECAH